MTKEEMVSWINVMLKKVTDLITGVPKNAALFIPTTNTTGMNFVSGLPVNWMLIATTPAEETSLKTGTEDFINVTTRLLWSKASGAWVSVPHTGNETKLRKCCLVIAKNTGAVWFMAETAIFYAVDTTSPTN